MTLDELWDAALTESSYASRAIVLDLLELCDRGEWRGYSSMTYPFTFSLIDRFLASHAKLNGPLGMVISSVPAQVFGWSDDEAVVKGATWATGAVLLSRPYNHEQIGLLFVSSDTATTWGYPDVQQDHPDTSQDHDAP